MQRYGLIICALFLPVLLVIQQALANTLSVYDYDIKHWTSANGLSSNSVRAITQDHLGYIWFGTLYGLNRFDGQQFEVFNTELQPKLASNGITRLLADSSGQIWVGTKAGLSIINPITLELERLPIFSEVTSILEVSPGEIWVAADQLFRIKDKTVRRVDEIKAVVSQLASFEQTLWVMSSELLYQRDPQGQWQQFNLPAELAQNPVYDMLWTKQGLLIASETGLYQLHADGQVLRKPLPDNTIAPVYRVFEDASGATWLSAYRKLFYQFQQQAWQTVTMADLGSSPWFSSIFQDQDNNIWLSSFSDGVFLASQSQIRRTLPGTDPIIRSVGLTPQGQLLYASQSNVGVMSSEGLVTPLISEELLQGQTVHDVYWPEQDTLWLGLERGLFEFSTADARLSPKFPSLQGQSIRVVQPDRSGGVWIGAFQGLFYAKAGELSPFPFNAELESRQVTTLSQNKNIMVFGTSRGFYRWQGERLTRLGIGSALYNAYILATLVLPDDTVLVSTLDDGIFIQLPGQPWLQLHGGNGLLHGPALSFYYHQPSGWIWVSTHKGIFRLWRAGLADVITEGFRLEEILSPYDRQMGALTSRCCNGAGQAKVVYWQQQLWYPTLRGVVAVPEQFSGSAPSGLQPVLNKLVAQQSYILSGTLQRQVLQQHERNLSISYSALEFKRPDSVIFRYKLQGFDEDWHYVANRREAVYTNLPPGVFEFVLEAKYVHQTWQDAAQTQIQLQIPKRFDETLVYRLLWLMLLLSSLYGIFWLYQQNNILKQEQLANLVRQRTQELENTNEKLHELNEQLSQLTHRDATTGLRNLRFLQEQLPKDIEHFQRNRQSLVQQGKTIALLLLEPIAYQQILHDFGSHSADGLLQQIGAVLIRETGGSDYVVRYQNERFVVVFRDVPVTQVAAYCHKLVERLSASDFIVAEEQSMPLATRGAFALYPLPLLGGQLLNWEVSMQLAEQALNQLITEQSSKQLATLVFDNQLDAFEFEETQDLTEQVRRLLKEGLLQLTYV